ncbi:hypothetical protein [Pseudomonas sp. TE50-2]|uniref:hypothetical protein n=1 Tax=Pseudomonas sp. TE50-2 TaxID=3142707 RepID=UPI003467DA3A
MSEKEAQQENNVTDFPSGETSKSSSAAQPQAAQELNADAKEEAFQLMMREYREKQKIDEEYQLRRTDRLRRSMYTTLTIFAALMILLFLSIKNPSIYGIDATTLTIVNQALNALILLFVPFLLGMIGAAARIMIATVNPEQKGNLLISSGLMATFSWIGIKSGVLISIIAPHLEKSNISTEQLTGSDHNFYTMALVAVLVGMFSTNLYLLVAEKVEQITRQNKNNGAD